MTYRIREHGGALLLLNTTMVTLLVPRVVLAWSNCTMDCGFVYKPHNMCTAREI